MTAIRPLDELLNGWWNFQTFRPTISNFAGAWNHPTAALSRGMLNSLIVAVPATLLPLFLATMAGYGLSRYKFRLRTPLFALVIIALALPQQTIAVPIFQMMNALNLVDTYLGLIIVHTAWGIPWIAFFMRNFFTTIPKAMEEAARIDGASDITIFFKVVLPPRDACHRFGFRITIHMGLERFLPRADLDIFARQTPCHAAHSTDERRVPR